MFTSRKRMVVMAIAALGIAGSGTAVSQVFNSTINPWTSYEVYDGPVDLALLQQVAAQALNAIQTRSHAQNREFCGYIGVTPDGQLRASRATRGRLDSCVGRAPGNWALVASYHSHAGYDVEADSEWPSVSDVQSDMEEGVYGFVSTPGGRLWFIDRDSGVASQIGGRGTLVTDPKFRREAQPPAPRYTLRDLAHWDRSRALGY